MRKFRNIYSIVAFLLISNWLYGQREQNLYAEANVKPDKVLLRWMPLDYSIWLKANKYGYTIVRETIGRDGKKLSNRIKLNLTTAPILPKGKAFWQELPKTEYASTAEDILFDKINPRDTIKASKFDVQTNNVHNLKLLMLSTAADMYPEIAEGLGLGYIDNTVKANEVYAYKLVNNTPSFNTDTIKVLVTAGSPTVYLPPSKPVLSYEYGNKAQLIWDHKATSPYIAYAVQRSDDGGFKYKTITKRPLVPSFDGSDDLAIVQYSDSLKILHKNYFYRIRGINRFGELSPPTDGLKLLAYETRLPAPLTVTYTIEKNKLVHLKWTYPDSLNNEFRGFKVKRASKIDSGYIDISPKIINRFERTFTDTKPKDENYYQIVAVDFAYKEIATIPQFVQLMDSIPPVKPVGLKGKVAKDGTVSLTWKRDTLEKVSYRLYTGDKPNREFILISPQNFNDTTLTYKVALNLLNKKMYYFVQALDIRYNPSVPSDTLILKRPDIIPPAAPTFLDYALSDSSINLKWANSPSEDVVFYNLLRKAPADSQACIVLAYDAISKRVGYADTELLDNITYQYSLVAIDESGLASKPEECQVNLAKLYTGIKPAIKPIVFDYDTVKNTLKLSWKPKANVKKYMLYRQKMPNDYMSTYKVLDAKYSAVLEADLEQGTEYRYQIMAYFEDETETKISEIYSILIPKKK
jgi:uncharacterized protein